MVVVVLVIVVVVVVVVVVDHNIICETTHEDLKNTESVNRIK